MIMCNNRLLLVLLCLCQIGIAQTSDFNCEIHISPRDSVIYSNEVQNIELSVDDVPNFLINWHGDSLDLADSLHPVATIPINQTRTYYLEAIYQNDSNLIVNGDFESGNTGFNTDLSYVANVGGCALCAESKYAVGTNPHNYHPSWVDTTREG